MGAVTVSRFVALGGGYLGEAAYALNKCEATYTPYGGCETCSLEFIAGWFDPNVTDTTEALTLVKDGLPVFSGRVISVKPSLDKSIQMVEVDGWWRRLDEISVIEPPADKILFGTPESDYPEVKTAFDVVRWLLDNRILNDTQSQIIEGEVHEPEATCKLGPSGFAIYANDQLGKILMDLAMMDDCVVGIDAEQEFYYTPRESVLGQQLLQITVAEEIPDNWRNSSKGFADGGDFIRDRRGPNYVAIRGRDINAARGTRSYKLQGTTADTRRLAVWYSPNVRHGQAARRLARGIFRRFTDYGLKVEDLAFRCGPRRLEPYLGAIIVTNAGEEVARKIAGSITVNWINTLHGSVTLGENKPEGGSGNPINDPLAKAGGNSDDAQVDTGNSSVIDFDDGYDGDGDDLHTNDDRESWEDPAGPGVDALDYGEDTVDPENGGTSASRGTALGSIHGVSGTWPTATYTVAVLNSENAGTGEQFTGVKVKPLNNVTFSIGKKVILHWPFGRTQPPVIDGAIDAHVFPAKITAVNPGEDGLETSYDVEVYKYGDGWTIDPENPDVEPVILQEFSNVFSWPKEQKYLEDQNVLVYTTGYDDKPVIMGPNVENISNAGKFMLQGPYDLGQMGNLGDGAGTEP